MTFGMIRAKVRAIAAAHGDARLAAMAVRELERRDSPRVVYERSGWMEMF